MKVVTPEISWHEREPVYSVDFQPGSHGVLRLASGGVDKIVRIWRFTIDEEGKGQVEFLANLRRHTATINVVRFSSNGEILASAGDDHAIILWRRSEEPTPSNNIFAEEDAEEDKETWVCHKTLRGHLGDMADLSWSRDSRFLVSGSVDNTAILWDVKKGTKLQLFSDHKSYVQGVALDPLGDIVALLSADRSMRLYNINTKSCLHNVTKMAALQPVAAPKTESGSEAKPESKPSDDTKSEAKSETKPESADAKAKSFRIFHDDSLRSFFRRLAWSPCGQLLVTPSGCVETADGRVANASFIFSRAALSKPAVYLPSGEKATTAVRVNPKLFTLRGSQVKDEDEKEKVTEASKSMFNLEYRCVFAVASMDSVLIYDSQQQLPIALVRNVHYQEISDLTWSPDGCNLVVSSADGFCTILTFAKGELGEVYQAQPTRVSSRQKEMKAKTEESKDAEEDVKCDDTNKRNELDKKPDSSTAEPMLTDSTNIEDVEMKHVDSNKESSETLNEKANALSIKEKNNASPSSSDAPKKKRIQFTTLLLNKK